MIRQYRSKVTGKKKCTITDDTYYATRSRPYHKPTIVKLICNYVCAQTVHVPVYAATLQQ